MLGIGGGGDVVGSLAIARRCQELETPFVVGGVAWERLPVDPKPGPRPANEIRDADLPRVLEALPWRERRVIELRYGLGDEGPLTLEDIGHQVGVTRERVRQIESKTLAMLKSSGSAERLAGTADEA